MSTASSQVAPEVTRLDNGLRIVSSTHDSPVTCVTLWLDTGTVDERDHEHGLAHFLEHLLFKGTHRRGLGASAGDIEALGGDLNAFTSLEQTVLHAVVPDRWADALDVLADMARRPLFDPDETVRERDVVLEEIRSYDDDPSAHLAESLEEALFGDHPYGRRVLGDAAAVAGFTADDARRFHAREWSPERAVVSVVGPAQHDDVVRLARELLGDWTPSPPRRLLAPPSPPSRGDLMRLNGGFESTGLQLMWTGPPLGHPDLPALEVLTTVLAQGSGGLLTNALHDADDPGFGAWADLDTRTHASVIEVGAFPHEDQAAATLAVVVDAVTSLARHVDGGAVERARTILRAGFVESDEDVEERCYDQAWYLATADDPGAGVAHRRAIASVTPADVRRVAAAWMSPERAMIGVLSDKGSTSKLQRARKPRVSRARPGPLATRIGHDTRLLVLPDAGPVVAVSVLAEGGDRVLTDRQAGLPEAWARTVTAGAGRLDARELQDALDALGASVDATTGRHDIGLQATTLPEHALGLLDRFGDLLVDPMLHHDDWDRVRDEMLDDARTRTDRPGEVATDLARRAFWGGHPWRLPAGGTRTSLSRMGASSLRRFHRSHFTGPNTLIVVVGPVDPDAVADAVAWVDDLEPHATARVAPPAPQRRAGLHVARAGQQQAHVAVYLPGMTLAQRARRGLWVAAAVLDGQAGRLFLELREKAALAYDVWAAHSAGIDGGIFAAGLATRPDRAEEAEHALLRSLHELAAVPPAPEELARAKASLIGRNRLRQQRARARAGFAAWAELSGEPHDLEAWVRTIEAVTPEEVAHEVAQALAHEPVVVRVLPEVA